MEKVPEGQFIIASNHLGRLDSSLLYYVFNRDDIILPTAEKYKNHPLYGRLGKAMGAIWLNRFDADIHAIKEILRRLKAGGLLAIAPEGTRSKSETLQEGKPGVAYLASKVNIPIIPIAITGTEDRLIKENLKHFRRSHILVRAGDPFMLAPINSKNREADLQIATDEIMCQIAAMLPEKYRGVYSDHPRLKELAN
jgi:1-acyl-sn-glycerol-3-phosphate acyltransferase